MVWRLLSKAISTTAIAMVLIAAFGLLYVHLNGMHLLSVQSGSMTPTIRKGDLVVVNSVPGNLAVGDVITYKQPTAEDVLITHRIVEIPAGDDFVITQGDANQKDDGLIARRNVVGRVDLNLPHMGAATDFIKQPAGLLLAVWVPAILIVVSEIRRLARHYRLMAPYKHPAADDEPTAPVSTKRKAQRVTSLGLALIIIGSAVSLPVWAMMFDTATLTGNSISSAKKPRRADHIVIRQLAFRCWDLNEEGINLRPSAVLYNPTKEKFELEGWTLESSSGVLVEFGPGDFLKKLRNLRIRPHLEEAMGLNSNGDHLVLKNNEGEMVDGISWGDDTSILNPALPAGADGVRYQRVPKKRDRDIAEDFKVRQYHGCSHPCFSYDPWESEASDGYEVHIRLVGETDASE